MILKSWSMGKKEKILVFMGRAPHLFVSLLCRIGCVCVRRIRQKCSLNIDALGLFYAIL
jgi:hypothetical protein